MNNPSETNATCGKAKLVLTHTIFGHPMLKQPCAINRVWPSLVSIDMERCGGDDDGWATPEHDNKRRKRCADNYNHLHLILRARLSSGYTHTRRRVVEL